MHQRCFSMLNKGLQKRDCYLPCYNQRKRGQNSKPGALPMAGETTTLSHGSPALGVLPGAGFPQSWTRGGLVLLPSSLTLPHCHIRKDDRSKAPWRGACCFRAGYGELWMRRGRYQRGRQGLGQRLVLSELAFPPPPCAPEREREDSESLGGDLALPQHCRNENFPLWDSETLKNGKSLCTS